MLSPSFSLAEARRCGKRGLLLAAVALLAPVASANAIEVEIDTAAVGHSDHLYPLYTPDYAENPGAQPEFLNDAGKVKDSVTNGANDYSSVDGGTITDEMVKDCAKQALAGLAWDVWWSVSEGQSFSLNEAGEHAIESCLDSVTSSSEPSAAHSIAATLATTITEGANDYLNASPDLYGLADWLQIVDYYYIEE